MSYTRTTSNGSTATATASTGGLSTLGVLGVAFVVLKLVGVINWSWWLVLLPFYGGIALFLAILLLGAVGGGIFYLVSTASDKRKAKQRRERLNKRV